MKDYMYQNVRRSGANQSAQVSTAEPETTMNDEIPINCWIRGEDAREVFTVEISPCKTVGVLKDKIGEKIKGSLEARRLRLSKVSEYASHTRLY
jgi:hypothetical protein